VRHRSDNFVKKSEPSNEMPDWWISSSWVPLEESDEASDEESDNVNDEEFIDITDSHNNDRNNNDNNNDNNENDNASSTTILTA